MTVTPSCPALLVHEDDAFRQALIAELDRRHFRVTFTSDGPSALKALREKRFKVILIAISVDTRRGMDVLEYIRRNRAGLARGVVIIGDPDPQLRSEAAVADETLLRPVDAGYVAERARVYCRD